MAAYPRLLPSSVNVLALQQQRQAVSWPAKREEIIQAVERLAGPEARRLFERFEAEVETLEQQNRARLRPPLLKIGSEQGVVSAPLSRPG